ncbi:hypothetical protein B0H13DRAFT_2284741 [Mycena leptocephala]|nr:hypothetical protein B0H13DRAFT_2284741 [Mycena leptocephala]
MARASTPPSGVPAVVAATVVLAFLTLLPSGNAMTLAVPKLFIGLSPLWVIRNLLQAVLAPRHPAATRADGARGQGGDERGDDEGADEFCMRGDEGKGEDGSPTNRTAGAGTEKRPSTKCVKASEAGGGVKRELVDEGLGEGMSGEGMAMAQRPGTSPREMWMWMSTSTRRRALPVPRGAGVGSVLSGEQRQQCQRKFLSRGPRQQLLSQLEKRRAILSGTDFEATQAAQTGRISGRRRSAGAVLSRRRCPLQYRPQQTHTAVEGGNPFEGLGGRRERGAWLIWDGVFLRGVLERLRRDAKRI